MDSSFRKLAEDCSASKDIDEGLKCSESGLSTSDHMNVTQMPEINEIPKDISIHKKTEVSSTSKDIDGGFKCSVSSVFTSVPMKVTQQMHGNNEMHSHSGKSFDRDNIFKCEVFKEQFPSESELNFRFCGHTGDTSQRHSVCGESPGKSQLKRRNTAQANKKHKCAECDKSFDCKSDLQAHSVVHTGSKDHKCDRCYRSYSQKSHLNRHYLKCTGEKLQCEICNKFFSNESDLDRHSSYHTVVKPLKCDICPKTFNYPSDFDKHYRIHTGDKPYKCIECNVSFSQAHNLKTHSLIHNR